MMAARIKLSFMIDSSSSPLAMDIALNSTAFKPTAHPGNDDALRQKPRTQANVPQRVHARAQRRPAMHAIFPMRLNVEGVELLRQLAGD